MIDIKPPANEDLPDRYLNAAETRQFIGGVSMVTLRRYVTDADAGFPQPFYVNKRMPLWKLSDLEGWMQRRPRQVDVPDNLKEGRKKSLEVRAARKAERDGADA